MEFLNNKRDPYSIFVDQHWTTPVGATGVKHSKSGDQEQTPAEADGTELLRFR